ncbi:MAG: UDP-N-acetylmuramoyl-L-alanyl-D-glutamate--2,6-diaminopimelate ligase [Myxococcota bacterium]
MTIRSLPLAVLLADIATPLGARAHADCFAERVTIDSRKVESGTVFVACRGATRHSSDGHDFVQQALAQGACALVVQDPHRVPSTCTIPVFVAPDSRVAAALLAERLCGNPSRELQLLGVTGTNGKSTVTFLIADLLNAMARPCAVFGTLGVGRRDTLRPLGYTTPEAEITSAVLAELIEQGMGAVAMEVSSHALATERVAGLHFRVAAFTNLSQDHLDFHGDMDSYFAAKTRLFQERLHPDGRIVLPDDGSIWSQRLREMFPDALLWGASTSAHAQVLHQELHGHGMRLQLSLLGERTEVSLSLLGQPNVDNVLCAAACGLALGYSPQEVGDVLPALRPVSGRFQPVPATRPAEQPAVVVDYAHTPDALARLLVAARTLSSGRVIVVFGCGGDRDRQKRALMAAAATESADAVILTNDNPRSESPETILDEIERGVAFGWQRVTEFMAEKRTYMRMPDRARAIATAIHAAASDDIVVIAGKGHEKTQIIGDMILEFDDLLVAREIMEGLA